MSRRPLRRDWTDGDADAVGQRRRTQRCQHRLRLDRKRPIGDGGSRDGIPLQRPERLAPVGAGELQIQQLEGGDDQQPRLRRDFRAAEVKGTVGIRLLTRYSSFAFSSVKDSPQPQAAVWLGLLKTKRAASLSRTKSISVPSRNRIAL